MKRGLTDIVNVLRGSTQIAKVMRGTTLIWQFAVAVTDYFTGYKARVEADYGLIEDEAQLQVEVVGEAKYDEALAIYNPNGGHRTAKIYDVRDYGTVKSFIETKSSNLGTSSGSATDGFLDYKNRPTAEKLESVADSGILQYTNINEKSGNTFLTFSAEVKKGDLKYARIFLAYTGSATQYTLSFDLDTLTFSTVDSRQSYDDLGNGWYRIKYIADMTASDGLGQYGVGFSSTDTGYTALTGEHGFMGRIQAIENNGYLLAENNPVTDLTVTGGGGTRINAVGLVEEVKYHQRLLNTDTLADSGKTNITVTKQGGVFELNEGTAAGYHLILQGSALYNSMRSVEFKMVNARYVSLSLANTPDAGYSTVIDLQNGVITDMGSFSTVNPTIIMLADGWVRVYFYSTDAGFARSNWSVWMSNGPTRGELTYTGTNRTVLIRKPQVSSGNELKSYQINTGTAAFPKIDYSTGQPAFLIEPTRTNHITNSYDFSGTAGYNVSGTLDQVGIEGKPNTATTITDNSATLSNKAVAVSGTYFYYYATWWVKKDNDETRFPTISLQQTSNTVYFTRYKINTKTGAVLLVTDTGAGHIYEMVDRGTWWQFSIRIGDGITKVASATSTISPAFSDVWDTSNQGSLQGSIIVGHAEMTYSDTLIGFPTTPIITNGAAVTRTYNYGRTTIPPIANFGVYVDAFMSNDIGAVNNRWMFFMGTTGQGFTNRLGFYKNSPNKIGFSYEGASPNKSFISTVTPERIKAYIKIEPSGIVKFFLNGVLEYTSTAVTEMPFFDDLFLGTFGDGSNTYNMNGSLYEFKITEIKTDQEAIDLTTL